MSIFEDDEQKKKKQSKTERVGEVGDRMQELTDLSKRIAVMTEKMLELETFAERIQQQQRNSNEFQMQLMKLSDATELEKGVTKVRQLFSQYFL